MLLLKAHEYTTLTGYEIGVIILANNSIQTYFTKNGLLKQKIENKIDHLLNIDNLVTDEEIHKSVDIGIECNLPILYNNSFRLINSEEEIIKIMGKKNDSNGKKKK